MHGTALNIAEWVMGMSIVLTVCWAIRDYPRR